MKKKKKKKSFREIFIFIFLIRKQICEFLEFNFVKFH